MTTVNLGELAMLMTLGQIIALWIWMLPLGGASMYMAWRKGQMSIRWIAYSALVPFAAIVHVLYIPKNYPVLEKRKLQGGYHVKCPRCAEIIKAEAQVCRFCQYAPPSHA